MTLSEFVAQTKRNLWGELKRGQLPSVGSFNRHEMEEAMRLGEVRMGTHQIHPNHVVVEFLFGAENPVVVAIRVDSPERIVFLPIPGWVIETIWQGDIAGSHHFESHANEMVQEFLAKLSPEANPAEFAPRPPRHRE